MRLFLGFVLFTMSLSVMAQDKLIVLHAIVGDTIDKQEQRTSYYFQIFSIKILLPQLSIVRMKDT